MTQNAVKTGRRLPAEQRREHLLDVAAEILLEQGFDALNMEAVKERAGVSRGLAYVYFKNADELAFALYEREAAELDRRIQEVKDMPGNFEARVRFALTAYLDFVAERGGLMAILQEKLTGRWSQASAQEALNKRFKFWSDAIERELGLSPHAAAALSRASIVAVEAFAAAWRAKKLSRAEAEAMAIAFALGGLRDAALAKPRAAKGKR
jgi:AcrR family transcriptional regulator